MNFGRLNINELAKSSELLNAVTSGAFGFNLNTQD